LRLILKEVQGLLSALSSALDLTGGLCALTGLILLIVGFKRDQQKRQTTVDLLDHLGVSSTQGWRWMKGELIVVGLLSSGMILITSVGLSVLGLSALNLPFSFFWPTLLFWSGLALFIPWILGLIPWFKKG
jgi:predicted lysophospholipase L1 biosynthesis ABC-type transport system permease subunit